MAKKNVTDDQQPILNCPCDFGNISVGDATASIGVKIERGWLNDSKARNVLCGRRATGTIVIGEVDPNQRLLIKDADYSVEGTFDVKSLSMKPKDWGLRLTFSRRRYPGGDLSNFAKQKGQLLIQSTEELPIAADEDSESEADEDVGDDGDETELVDGKLAAAGK